MEKNHFIINSLTLKKPTTNICNLWKSNILKSKFKIFSMPQTFMFFSYLISQNTFFYVIFIRCCSPRCEELCRVCNQQNPNFQVHLLALCWNVYIFAMTDNFPYTNMVSNFSLMESIFHIKHICMFYLPNFYSSLWLL